MDPIGLTPVNAAIADAGKRGGSPQRPAPATQT